MLSAARRADARPTLTIHSANAWLVNEQSACNRFSNRRSIASSSSAIFWLSWVTFRPAAPALAACSFALTASSREANFMALKKYPQAMPTLPSGPASFASISIALP